MRPSEASAQAKVGKFNVAVAVDEYIIGLNVTVNKTHLVHALNCAHELRDIKPISNYER